MLELAKDQTHTFHLATLGINPHKTSCLKHSLSNMVIAKTDYLYLSLFSGHAYVLMAYI